MVHTIRALITVLLALAVTIPVGAQLADVETRFLHAMRLDESLGGDLPEILARGRLRVLVAYNQTTYFVDGGRPRGVAYEALHRFADRLDAGRDSPLEVVFVPLPRERLLSELQAGRGDIAAGGLARTAARQSVVDFTRPIFTGAREVLVTGPATPAAAGPDDLGGVEVFAGAATIHLATLQGLATRQERAGTAPVLVREAAPGLEDEDLLQMVHAGLVPATVTYAHIAELWKRVLPGLRVHEGFPVREGGEIAWAVRPDTPQLLAALDAFITKEPGESAFARTLHHRYLESARFVRRALAPADHGRFATLGKHFRTYGARYELDWLLLAAQGYQESRLDQNARSAAGAVGVMQLLPSTAAAPPVSIPGVADSAEQNIHAGARYMRVILDRYLDEPGVPELDRHLLALAAYNAGPTRLRRLRGEAAERGFDPDRWFDEMEVVVGEKVGREPVLYVANIYQYYVGYKLAEARVKARESFTDPALAE